MPFDTIIRVAEIGMVALNNRFEGLGISDTERGTDGYKKDGKFGNSTVAC